MTVSDEDLVDQILAKVERTYSTKEAVAFLNRSEPWMYWVLEQGTMVREDGTEIVPEKIGKKMRFSLKTLKDIAACQYRRGNYTDEEMTLVTRRIKVALRGGDWRELDEDEVERKPSHFGKVNTE